MIRTLSAVLALILILTADPVPAQTEERPPAPEYREEIIPRALQDSWAAYRTALAAGNETGALQALKELNTKAKAIGIENAEAVSTAVLRDAASLLKKGKSSLAIDLSRSAQEISPDFPASYFFRGRAYLQSDPFNVVEEFDAYFQGWSKAIRHLWTILFAIEAGTFWFMVTGMIAFLVYTFSLVLRYTPRISHLIFELAGHRLYNPTIYVLVAVLLIGPLWLGLGLVWAVIWWLIIFWVFMTLQERIIALLFVIVTATAGLWMPAWISVGKVKESRDFRMVARAVAGEPGLPSETAETFPGESDTTDGLVALAKGIQYRKAGRYDLARQQFQRAADALPDDERVLINLGNMAFYENRMNDAMGLYQRAIEINPNSVEAHYNLAQASRENLLFEEGERHYQEAKQLDEKRTEVYTSRSAVEGGLPVIDAPIELNEALVQAAMFRTDEIRKKADELFTLLWSASISSAPLIGLLFGAVLMLLSPRGYIKRLSFPCGLCGRIICHACQKHIFHLRVCHACSEQNKNVKRFSDLRQLQQRREREMRLARLVSLLVPGTGHLYLMQSIRGFLFAFTFAAMLLWFFGKALPFFVPYAWMLSSQEGSLVFLAGGLLILYAIVFLDLTRLQDMVGEEELWR